MHYYKKNIGDYYKKAGRLSMLEHGAYTMLIDACYDRERFPTLEDALDWTWARTDAEVEAVKFVLSKFFELNDGIYTQSRIADELENYHALSETNSRIAKEREEKRRNRKRTEHEACTDGSRYENEAPPNHKPLTINQEPLTSNQYKYIFDLDYVNANLLKSGTQMVDQKFVDELQPQFELYYADQPMTENKALVKFVQWIMRNKNSSNVGQNTYQSSQQKTEAEMDKWRNFTQSVNHGNEPIDITPEQQNFIEG